MPPLPRLRIGALDDLAKQLRFAPPETLRRQMERAQQLAAEIDPAVNYPEEWIVFRITGYRPQLNTAVTVVGHALLSDMSALVERLSSAARIRESELEPGTCIAADELCARWQISRKTLDRYRRAGLVAMRVLGTNNKPRLLFPLDAVRKYESKHTAQLADAKAFHRLGHELEQQMLRRAARYARAGMSLNQAAAKIAQRYSRGHETVRQLLQRNNAPFVNRGPPNARERRVIQRAGWRWIEPSDIAAHLGRSRASIQRIFTDARAARLRQLTLPGSDASRSQHIESIEAVLSHSAAHSGLGVTAETDLLHLIQEARHTPAPAAAQERPRALAYHALLVRAGNAISTLPEHEARATTLDRIETDLRWAARLKACLIASQMGQLVRSLESALARPLEEVRATLLRELILAGIGALGTAVDSFEGRKGGRLAATAGISLNRMTVAFLRRHARDLAPSAEARAVARLTPGVHVPDWTRNIAPWQHWHNRPWLEPDSRLRSGLCALHEQDQLLLTSRFGWGQAPHTHTELAKRFETTSMRIAMRERQAARTAIAHARTAAESVQFIAH